MKRFFFVVTSLALVSCSTVAPPVAGPIKINPASLAAEPAKWDGKEVEVTGLLVWEFERLRLFQSYGAYCRDSDKTAIGVDWNSWPGVTKADNRREVIVRGIFRNRYGAPQPNGQIIISGAQAGPLEPGSVVRWLSKPAKPCPKALP